jgi:NAD(P)-dependent dehydrogenase (short-subunit alcohol dehydrogenase family)
MTTSLVTGANRGIGREVAVQLAGLGHHVLLGARRPEAAASVAEAIGAGGGRSTIVPLDIADPSSAAAARTVCEELGGLDVLVNNAAIMYDTWQSAVHPDFEAVREALDTNLFGTWRLTTALAPLISASPHGRIVNVSSGAGALTDMGGHLPAYRISKVGLNALTRMWAAELPGTLVNAVCPGWVATDMGGGGGRPVDEGAAGIVWAATLDDDGPTGGFFRDRRPIPW